MTLYLKSQIIVLLYLSLLSNFQNKHRCRTHTHTKLRANFSKILLGEIRGEDSGGDGRTEKNSVFTKSSMKIDFRGIVLKNTVFSVFSVFSVFLCGSTTKNNN